MSWKTYKMIDYDPRTELTMASIFKRMKLFEKKFEVKVSAIEHPMLLVWELELEDKKRQIKTRRSDVQSMDESIIRKYICALSNEEELLFTNKVLGKELRNTMVKALSCSKLNDYPLGNAIPSNLLMMYNQAKDQNPAALELQYQEKKTESVDQLMNGIPLSNNVEDPVDKKEVHLKLGSNPEKIPQIKKVSLVVNNVPINTENPKLKGFRFEEIDVEIGAGSVFHMYLHLAEQGIIKQIPPWVTKMRSRGKTHTVAHYS